MAGGGGVSRARRASRASSNSSSIPVVVGCSPPSKPFDGVAALPIGEATARGVSEGVLAHDAHNSYHYADAGRLYELEMLLNAFAIASRRQP